MKKVSLVNATGPLKKANKFCPQPAYLYGTYREDGKPNFGMFTWLSYCWDGELHVMCAIGGEKLTKDRIHTNGVFSANLVTEKLLPLADWLGSNHGYDTDKSAISAGIARGAVLNVPTLTDSPVTLELEVKQTVPLDDSEIFICRIANILADERLTDESVSIEDRMRLVEPIIYTGSGPYCALRQDFPGKPGDWKASPSN
jgi:flavin reductase (DIM6/NTAB) family NADH-FMN oxidoreductase RutF